MAVPIPSSRYPQNLSRPTAVSLPTPQPLAKTCTNLLREIQPRPLAFTASKTLKNDWITARLTPAVHRRETAGATALEVHRPIFPPAVRRLLPIRPVLRQRERKTFFSDGTHPHIDHRI